MSSSLKLPAEWAVPPANSQLRLDAESGEWHLVRPLPAQLLPEVREQILRAAEACRAVQHPGLIPVLSVLESEIVSEWPSAASLAQWRELQPSGFPLETVASWLGPLAEMLEVARQQRLQFISLELDRVLVLVPADQVVALSPAELGACHLALDPLAAFDPALAAALEPGMPVRTRRRIAGFTALREYVAGLARLLNHLLPPAEGGLPRTRKLLAEAMKFRLQSTSVTDWAEKLQATLLEEVPGLEATSAPQAAPTRESAVPEKPAETLAQAPITLSDASPATEIRGNEPEESVAATPSVNSVASALGGEAISSAEAPVPKRLELSAPQLHGPAVKKPRRRARVQWLALLAGVALAAGAAIVFFDQRQPEQVHVLVTQAANALDRRDMAKAQRTLETAERIAPGNAEVGELRREVAALAASSISSLTETPAQVPADAGPTAETGPPAAAEAPRETSNPLAASRKTVFRNSLGMRFVPIAVPASSFGNRNVLFSIYETRVSDYRLSEEGAGWRPERYQSTGEYPASGLTAGEAVRFCGWLSEHEKALLPPGWIYRLPTDYEWSCAVGLGAQEDAGLPATRKVVTGSPSKFPWGTLWPPPLGAGNFADVTLVHARPGTSAIPGYQDGYPYTAPVGRFMPNAFGLFDMAGNVAEWCSDFQPQAKTYLLRGGSWSSSARLSLASAARTWVNDSHLHSQNCGFRAVLAESAARRTEAKLEFAAPSANRF